MASLSSVRAVWISPVLASMLNKFPGSVNTPNRNNCKLRFHETVDNSEVSTHSILAHKLTVVDFRRHHLLLVMS